MSGKHNFDVSSSTYPASHSMSNFPRLKVVRWGGLIAATHQTIPEVRGHVVDEAMISSNLRRRMGRLERLAARCALGVLKSDHRQGEQTGELIFCSRFGNVETLETLLCSLYLREPVSPMAFSGSVHNAAPGL